MSRDRLAATIVEIAASLPASRVAAWVLALSSVDNPSPGVEAALVDAQPGYAVATTARRLVDTWRTCAPDLGGAAVALALRTAARMQQQSDAQRAELVVSGPTSSSVPVRLTSAVVVDVIRSAHRSLLVVSYAAYRVTEVVRELARAAANGIHVDLVLEGTAADGGTLRGNVGGAEEFAELRQRARFWCWPASQRPIAGSSRAALHAKIIAADTHTALISSANLTDRALYHNLEVGVVLHDPNVVRRLVDHFTALMNPATGQLARQA